jgi:hypothetical protein
MRGAKPMIRLLHRGLVWALLGGLALSITTCGDSTPESERAARTFVEAYYVRADLVAARRLTTGLAREKIERQVRLRTLAEADREPAPTSPGLSEQRDVKYKVLETREREGGRKIYRIGLTISTSPLTLETQTLITVGAKGEGEKRRWLVLNFVDFNRPSAKNAGK